MKRVGLISDTHGLLRPEALEAMRGSDFIVHAGDVGDEAIITRLAAIAPVTVVRGNNDVGPWAASIPCAATLIVGIVRIHVVHDIAELATDPHAEGFHVVVCGHSHRPRIEARDDVLYVNPGSAGPRRFALPVSVGSLVVSGSRVEPEVCTLEVAPPKSPSPRARSGRS